MNTEEVLLKLGIRTDSFSQGIEKSKAEMTRLGEHIKKEFAAPDQGKGLISIFDKLTEKAPLLGTAFSLALNPLHTVLDLAFKGFDNVMQKYDEFSARIREKGEAARQSERGDVREAKFQGRLEAEGSARETAWWLNDLENGRPGEAEQKRIKERMEQARVEAGGDPVKEAQARIRIMEEERAAASKQMGEAAQQVRELEARKGGRLSSGLAASDEAERQKAKERIAENQKRAHDIDQDIYEMEMLAKDRTGDSGQLGFGGQVGAGASVNPDMLNQIGKRVGVDFTNEGNLSAVDVVAKLKEERDRVQAQLGRDIRREKQLEESASRGIAENANIEHEQGEAKELGQAAKNREKQLADSINQEKRTLMAAESARQQEELANAIKIAEKKAHADKVAFLQEKVTLEERAALKAKERGDMELERKLLEQLKVDRVDLAEESVKKEKAQESFNKALKLNRNKILKESQEKYLATEDEIANSAAWNPAMIQQYGFQAAADRMAFQFGTTYEQQYAGVAQEKKLAEQEAAMAFRVEGPDSERFKQADEKVRSLQKDLDKSGLIKPNTVLEKLEKTNADLLNLAKEQGLKVQPANGE